MKKMSASPILPVLLPNWQAPKTVHALTTLKNAHWELGLRSPNCEHGVKALTVQYDLPSAPLFLQQVHSNKVFKASDGIAAESFLEGDGWYTNQPEQVLGILTADCLPILLCDKSGQEIAALHGGWRGVARGIIPQALSFFNAPLTDLMVWIGPGIGYDAFEVGQEVYDQFASVLKLDLEGKNLAKPHPSKPEHWFLNLSGVAKHQLVSLGVPTAQVYCEHACTHTNAEQFYSHRRNQEKGRMATIIWQST